MRSQKKQNLKRLETKQAVPRLNKSLFVCKLTNNLKNFMCETASGLRK